jgi:hypothetical protein
MAGTPTGGGYWIVSANGNVFPFGDAKSFGTLPSLNVNVNNIISIVPVPGGAGYWLIGKDGGLFAFGNAPFENSLPGINVHVNNIVGGVPTAAT